MYHISHMSFGARGYKIAARIFFATRNVFINNSRFSE